MRIGAFILIGVGLNAALGTAAPLSQELRDYELGSAAGRCLAVQCQIFRGTIVTEAPKSGEPIIIRVEEALFGISGPTNTVRVPHDATHYGDAGSLFDMAWARATIKKDAQVTVVLGAGRGFGVLPGEPAVVTSNERDAGIIRFLVQETSRLRSSPDLISQEVASLSGNPNPALAAYLFAYLSLGKTEYPRELTATLYTRLLGHLRGATDEEFAASAFLPSLYKDLPPSGQAAIVVRLAELAQGTDSDLGGAAIHGLGRIVSRDPSAHIMLPPGSTSGLESAYRALVEKGSIKRDAMLETELGITAQ
jgi:hypothetical protein